MSAVLKWLAGIAASIITGVVIWQLTHQSPAHTPPSPDDSNRTPPAAAVCHVGGAVYDRDTNQPLTGIEVHYVRFTQDPNEWIHGVRSRLATTGPDGRFSADCSTVEAENFPLRLELVGSNWRSRFQTDEYVRQGEGRNDINIYVPDRLLR
jgi:hypothetical protein